MAHQPDSPAVENALANAVRVLRSVIAESMGIRLYGKVNVELSFQNGKLQLIQSTHVRNYQVKD